MILSAISDRLGLSSVHNNSAYTVLRNYGNMSSATLIFVLRELLDQFAAGESEPSALPPNCSPFVPALAFGPGLNVEGQCSSTGGGTVRGSAVRCAPAALCQMLTCFFCSLRAIAAGCLLKYCAGPVGLQVNTEAGSD
jgi:hypothetical protein